MPQYVNVEQQLLLKKIYDGCIASHHLASEKQFEYGFCLEANQPFLLSVSRTFFFFWVFTFLIPPSPAFMNFFVCTIFAVPSIIYTTVAYLALGVVVWCGMCSLLSLCIVWQPSQKHFLMCQVELCANKVKPMLVFS